MIKRIKQTIFEYLKKRVKIGVSYNVFDGEELLPFSIKAIRNNVQYISVVYQKVSNFGNLASVDLQVKLEKLKEEGLIDELYLYETDLNLDAHQNEKNKRNIGLKLAKKNRCNYFLSMDVDEFYDAEQFDYAVDKIIKNNIQTSAVGIIEYLKSPENMLVGGYTFEPKGVENYNFYVPFLVKISKFKKQSHGKDYFPCITDPTRSLSHSGRFKLFSEHEIVMHHMSTVRLDLKKKYDNSNLMNSSPETQEHVREIQNEILQFDFEKNKVLPQDCSIFKGNLVKKVANKFGIEF